MNGGILQLMFGNLHAIDVTLENNSVDDFDDYSVYSSGSAVVSPDVNFGREFWAIGESLKLSAEFATFPAAAAVAVSVMIWRTPAAKPCPAACIR